MVIAHYLGQSINGHNEVVKLLLRNGAQIHLQDNGGFTPLHYAASIGHHTVIRLVLNKGAQANILSHTGASPLMLASMALKYDAVKVLIEYGAQVNIRALIGCTALICAHYKGFYPGSCYKVVKLLLENGAQPNIQDFTGCFALVLAKYYEVAKVLLDYGAQINMQDKLKMSSLHSYISNKQLKMVELLLDRGAQTNLVSNNGHSALTLAAEIGDYGIIRAFQERARVDRTNLWRALKVAIDTCHEKDTYDKNVIELLCEMCLDVIRRNQVFVGKYSLVNNDCMLEFA